MARPRKPKVHPSVPTREIDWKLGRTHVSTPDSEVEQMLRDAVDRAASGERAEAWTPAIRRQTIRYGLWRHRANRQEYTDVMRQDPGGYEPHVGRPGPGPDASRWSPQAGEQEIEAWQSLFHDRRRGGQE